MSFEIFDYIGPVPFEEECAQTLEADFTQRNIKECKRFKELLEKVCPPPNGAKFSIKVETGHDYGSYREVVSMVDMTISQEDEICAWIDKCNKLPGTWTELEAMSASVA